MSIVLGLSRALRGDHVRPQSCPERVTLVASGAPNQVQAGTGDVRNPHSDVGVSSSINLKLFGCEIIFEVFQPM